MRRFDLLEPSTLPEAVRLLADLGDEGKVIAGGTTLLILIKHGLFIPQKLINLKKVAGASYVERQPGQGLRIGALTSIYDVETAPVVRQGWPILAEAAHQVANIRIRNLATLGGNLAHADYQSDPPAVLTALEASVRALGPSGERTIPLRDLYLGLYETALAPDEVVSEVEVPDLPAGMVGAYIRFTTRSAEDRPAANIAALLALENGRCRELRLVVGAVCAVPCRVSAAEEKARGEPLTPELLDEIGRLASEAVDPIDDLRGSAWYKKEIVAVLARRAVEECVRRAGIAW